MMQPEDEELALAWALQAETFLLSVWRRLQQTRIERGWTIDQAAEEIDVDTSTYQRWEQGRQRPRLSHLLALIEAFGLEGIFDGDDVAFARTLVQLDSEKREAIITYLKQKQREKGSIPFLWWLKHFEHFEQLLQEIIHS